MSAVPIVARGAIKRYERRLIPVIWRIIGDEIAFEMEAFTPTIRHNESERILLNRRYYEGA